MKYILMQNIKKLTKQTIAMSLNYLIVKHKNSSLEFLQKEMFGGYLGKYKGSTHTIKIKNNAKPFPIQTIDEYNLKNKLDRLIDVEVLKQIHNSQWATPTFIILKTNCTVRFISEFRELNKTIKMMRFPIPNNSTSIAQIRRF